VIPVPGDGSLRRYGVAPARVTADQFGSYAAALTRLPELAGVEHVRVRAALRCNIRLEQAHEPRRRRERFESLPAARRFLAAFSRAGNHFRLRRHLLTVAEHRAVRRGRYARWRELARSAA
jgi:putative transposase